jgi:preprotein translocase subunit SecD
MNKNAKAGILTVIICLAITGILILFNTYPQILIPIVAVITSGSVVAGIFQLVKSELKD